MNGISTLLRYMRLTVHCILSINKYLGLLLVYEIQDKRDNKNIHVCHSIKICFHYIFCYSSLPSIYCVTHTYMQTIDLRVTPFENPLLQFLLC